MQPISSLGTRIHEIEISRAQGTKGNIAWICLCSLRAGAVAVSLLLPSARSASAQTIPFHDYRFERGSFMVQPVPADAPDLVPVHGGRTGKVWLQQSQEGIIILGKINGARPEWARFPLELNVREHVDVWLAAVSTVEMPEIGWGNQFGYTDCKNYDSSRKSNSAENCPTWSARQVAYRAQFQRLFVRQWQMAPGLATENFATEAYRRILSYANDSERPNFEKLKPTGTPDLESMDSSGYSSFEIFMRWSDFPPASSLKLSRIYLAVEVFDTDNVYSTTTPTRNGGDPSSFKQLELGRPIQSSVDSCNSPLSGLDPFQKEHSAWYFPAANGDVADVFIIINDAGGYRYDPAGLSPIPSWTHYFSKDLGNGNIVCGPLFRYLAGAKTHYFKTPIKEQPLATLALSDGSFLLKSGPNLGTVSRFGSGQCGSCLGAATSVFHLDPDKGITPAFSGSFVLDDSNCTDGDIQVSADWKTVIVYTAKQETIGKEPNWSSKRYCFAGSKYDDCGSGPSGPPPNPRQVIFTKFR